MNIGIELVLGMGLLDYVLRFSLFFLLFDSKSISRSDRVLHTFIHKYSSKYLPVYSSTGTGIQDNMGYGDRRRTVEGRHGRWGGGGGAIYHFLFSVFL